MTQDEMKQAAAQAALSFIQDNMVVGVGTGSTTNFFIDALATYKHRITCAVASSIASAKRLQACGIEVVELNNIDKIDIYVDGADEATPHLALIKGGGGALTREKILATASSKFICIIDQNKQVDVLGQFPLPIEVIPMARSYVAREIVKLGGDPAYREGFTTDNGNIILDIHNLDILDPTTLEKTLNNLPGLLCNGLFALRKPDTLLVGDSSGVSEYRVE